MAFGTIEEQQKINSELERINEIYELIASENTMLSKEQILEYILGNFSDNSQKILNTSGTPAYLMLEAATIDTQILSGTMNEIFSRIFYTQSNGENLSMVAGNFGKERVEAKQSSLVAIINVSKNTVLSANTSFTDGAGTIWLSQNDVTIQKNAPTRVSFVARDSGVINFISPLTPTNPITNLETIEVDMTSIVIGREQESDASLKSRIATGISSFGSDEECQSQLMTIKNVLGSISKMNYTLEDMTFNGKTISPLSRYVCVRVTNTNVSQEEADNIANIIRANSFLPNFQKPEDLYVKAYFGLTEAQLKDTVANGGAGITNGVKDDSDCVLVRVSLLYGNYMDIFFYIAKTTPIICKIDLRYKSSYSVTEKENMSGNIKEQVTQSISELSQVGGSMLASSLAERILSQSDYTDKITIRSILFKRFLGDSVENDTDYSQSLDANANEYFQVYSTLNNIYAGIKLIEV